MSYDVSLVDPVTGETIEAEEPHQIYGGTHAVGGTKELWLNITYNYALVLSKLFGEKGVRELYGKTGAESIPILRTAIAALTDEDLPVRARHKFAYSVAAFREADKEFLKELNLCESAEYSAGVCAHINTLGEKYPEKKGLLDTYFSYFKPNYWQPSDKNVKAALYGLLAFAQLRPDGIWKGD